MALVFCCACTRKKSADNFRTFDTRDKHGQPTDATAPGPKYTEGICWECSIKEGVEEPVYTCANTGCMQRVRARDIRRHTLGHASTKQARAHLKNASAYVIVRDYYLEEP